VSYDHRDPRGRPGHGRNGHGMIGVDLDLDVDAFRTFGFVVLPQAIDPAPLAD
jgi:hypothetical protein